MNEWIWISYLKQLEYNIFEKLFVYWILYTDNKYSTLCWISTYMFSLAGICTIHDLQTHFKLFGKCSKLGHQGSIQTDWAWTVSMIWTSTTTHDRISQYKEQHVSSWNLKYQYKNIFLSNFWYTASFLNLNTNSCGTVPYRRQPIFWMKCVSFL